MRSFAASVDRGYGAHVRAAYVAAPARLASGRTADALEQRRPRSANGMLFPSAPPHPEPCIVVCATDAAPVHAARWPAAHDAAAVVWVSIFEMLKLFVNKGCTIFHVI